MVVAVLLSFFPVSFPFPLALLSAPPGGAFLVAFGLLGPSLLLVFCTDSILVCAGTPLLGFRLWISGTSRAGLAF